MDQTPEYLEMCSKLPSEIKNLVPRDHQGCMGGDKSFFGYYERLNGMVWLPRQDQLQDMLKDKIRYNHKNTYGYVKGPAPEGFIAGCLHQEFHKFMVYEDQYIFCEAFNSMEQLWLAFVMHEKYNKRWDGKEWV
jgi:hypothetical protein